MFRKQKVAAPIDLDLQQIDQWEAGRLAAHRQQMQDDGLDADTIAREYPPKAAVITAIAERMRSDHRSNQARSLQP